MKPRLSATVLALLIIGAVMWLWQIRFTPEAAARAVPTVRGDIVRTARLPGGAAFLFHDGERYSSVAACRRALVLWMPCASGGFVLGEESPMPSFAHSAATGGDWNIILFAGRVLDERVSRVVWAGEEQILTGDRHFLFARRVRRSDGSSEGSALSANGVAIYTWSAATFFNWQPVAEPTVDGCPPLPAGWSPLTSDQGAVTGAVFGPSPDAIFLSLAEGGVQILNAASEKPSGVIGTRRFESFRVSPDGSTLVGGVEGQLWKLDLATGAQKPLGLRSHGVLAWTSPTTFAFVDLPSGTVSSLDVATQAVTRLTSGVGAFSYDHELPVAAIERLGRFPAFDGSLSSDRTQLVLSQGHSGNAMVVLLDLASGRMYTYPKTSGDGMSPRWEPDGRHVLHGWGLLKRLDTVTGTVEDVKSSDFPANRFSDVSADGRVIVRVLTDGTDCLALGRLAVDAGD